MILIVCLFTMICTVYMSQGINILNGVLTYMKMFLFARGAG